MRQTLDQQIVIDNRPVRRAMELFKNRTGTFITHIPYRGAAPAMADVMGGQVPCMFLDLASGLPIMQGQKVRVLAIGSGARSKLLPDVPTLAITPAAAAIRRADVQQPPGFSGALLESTLQEGEDGQGRHGRQPLNDHS